MSTHSHFLLRNKKKKIWIPLISRAIKYQKKNFMGESSKFPKSRTFETQFLKFVVCPLNIHNFKFKWSNVLLKDRLIINQRSHYASLIQHFEADFLWKVSCKILNSGIILKPSPMHFLAYLEPRTNKE